MTAESYGTTGLQAASSCAGGGVQVSEFRPRSGSELTNLSCLPSEAIVEWDRAS